MPYDMDYRRAVAAAHDECGSSAEVAEQFGCSASWVRRLIQHRRDRGTLAPRSTARPDDQRTYTDADEATIRALIRDKPDATLAEVAAALGKPAAESTVSRALKRLGLPRKKSRRTRPSSAGPTSRPPGPGGSARPTSPASR
jgi:transposase